VPAVPYNGLTSDYFGEPSSEIRKRVQNARNRQLERFKRSKIYSNGQMAAQHIRKFCKPPLVPKKFLTWQWKVWDSLPVLLQEYSKYHAQLQTLKGQMKYKATMYLKQYRTLDRDGF
jgi:predicted ATPase with chaperone activity